uniref:Tegument protein VP16 n=1 Tax=Anthurium amnicola TaxID=1678845 RepID=A0A1D1YDR1_9ARAE
MDDAVEWAGTNSAKRVRDESGESPEAKRLRAAGLIFLDILEDVDSSDRALAAPADGDLATVLKSLEEEIAFLSPIPSQQPEHVPAQAPSSTSASESDESRQSDLDYLLGASDDDLGLPPTVQSSDDGEGTEADPGEDGIHGDAVLGQIWGFEDEIPSYYESLDFGGFGEDDAAAEVGSGVEAVFDGGLFGYPDAAFYAQSDFADRSRRPESLPAV